MKKILSILFLALFVIAMQASPVVSSVDNDVGIYQFIGSVNSDMQPVGVIENQISVFDHGPGLHIINSINGLQPDTDLIAFVCTRIDEFDISLYAFIHDAWIGQALLNKGLTGQTDMVNSQCNIGNSSGGLSY